MKSWNERTSCQKSGPAIQGPAAARVPAFANLLHLSQPESSLPTAAWPIPEMRGSPLIKSLVVLAALVLAAVGLRALDRDPPARSASASEAVDPAAEAISTPFFATSSTLLRELCIETGGKRRTFAPDGFQVAGQLSIEGEHPTIFVTATPVESRVGPPVFLELTLEPPGRPTLTQIFKGQGSIDEVWEFHLHP
jgi:hypothetical protein